MLRFRHLLIILISYATVSSCMEDEVVRSAKCPKIELGQGIRKFNHEYPDKTIDEKRAKKDTAVISSKKTVEKLNRSNYLVSNKNNTSLLHLASRAVRFGTFDKHLDEVIKSVFALSGNNDYLPEPCQTAVLQSNSLYTFPSCLKISKEINLGDLVDGAFYEISFIQDKYGNYIGMEKECKNPDTDDIHAFLFDSDTLAPYELPKAENVTKETEWRFNDTGYVVFIPENTQDSMHTIYVGNPKKNISFIPIEIPCRFVSNLKIHQSLPYLYSCNGSEIFCLMIYQNQIFQGIFNYPGYMFEEVYPISSCPNTFMIAGDSAQECSIYRAKMHHEPSNKIILNDLKKYAIDVYEEDELSHFFLNYPLSDKHLLRMNQSENFVVQDITSKTIKPLSINDSEYSLDTHALNLIFSFNRVFVREQKEMLVLDPITSTFQSIKGERNGIDWYRIPFELSGFYKDIDLNVCTMAPNHENYEYMALIYGSKYVSSPQLILIEPGKPRRVLHRFKPNETVQRIFKTKNNTLVVQLYDKVQTKLVFFAFQDVYEHEMVNAELLFIEKLLQEKDFDQAAIILDRLLKSECIKKVSSSVVSALTLVHNYLKKNNFLAADQAFCAFKNTIIIPTIDNVDIYTDLKIAQDGDVTVQDTLINSEHESESELEISTISVDDLNQVSHLF